MVVALKAANTKGIPVILDPVGVGATSYRTETTHSILIDFRIIDKSGPSSFHKEKKPQ